jgi:hypothetical protein
MCQPCVGQCCVSPAVRFINSAFSPESLDALLTEDLFRIAGIGAKI